MASIPTLLTRSFGMKKKGPGKRSQYALRRKEEIQGYKRSPFGLEGRPVKQFDELKFYHARNKHGQKETLIDPRRRDIDFFDPVEGGFNKDPRDRYKDKKSGGSVGDEEAALYADYTDTDDEDIYFGGGNDADGDYDDEGNELRPRAKGKKASWADPDPPLVEEDETDPDEDEREFNEVFGRDGRNRKPMRRNQRGQRGQRGQRYDDDDDDDMEEEMESRKFRNLQRRGAQLFVDTDSPPRNTRPPRGKPPPQGQQKRQVVKKRNFSKPDPEIGIDPVAFKKRFEKKSGETKPTADKNFSADEFLKEGDEISSEEEAGSEWDEQRMIEAGDEELEELTDVSDMMRDYDRPSRGQRIMPVTEKMAKEEKKLQMQEGEFYESDDVEFPYAEDPELQEEIAVEHEENVKKLRSTPGGRKMLKSLNREPDWIDDFPLRGKQFYENALKETPMDGPPPAAKEYKPIEKKRINNPVEDDKVRVVNRDDPMAAAAPLKKEDSWRRMSLEFDDEARDGDFLGDLKEDEIQRRERLAQKNENDRYRLKGRPPYGGTGIRHYSTSAPPMRNVEPSSVSAWCENALERTYDAQYTRRDRIQYLRSVNKAMALQSYWSRFPSDETIQSLVPTILGRLKLQGTLYVAMTIDRKLLFGVTAPHHTFKGTTNVANHFEPEAVPFVKVDLKRFRRMKQRGEIITGGPHLHGSLGSETSSDWTGSAW